MVQGLAPIAAESKIYAIFEKLFLSSVCCR